MMYTREQIEWIVRKLLADINEPYREQEPMIVEYEENLTMPGIKPISRGWFVGVPTDDYEREKPEGAHISVGIDDDSGEVEGYLSGPGRPIPLAARKDASGKYRLVSPT